MLLLAGVLLQGQRQPVPVSATILPAARIEILSSTAARVQVVLHPSTQALVWLTAGTCDAPRDAQVLPGSGIHRVTFPEQDTPGQTLCVVSTDGAVHAESRFVK